MSVPAAYIGVILIWSTTPLAIKWSNGVGSYFVGVTGRMAIGALLCAVLMLLWKVPFPRHKKAYCSYFAVSCPIFASMTLTYWSAQFIPSGLISVIFGMTPMVTSLLSVLWLRQIQLDAGKWFGMLLGILGLVIIFNDKLLLNTHSTYGILAVLLATTIYGASSVWVKQLNATDISPLALTCGGLWFSLPWFAIGWWLTGQTLPITLPLKATLALLYLAVFGSVIGFVLYYYVLKHLDVNRAALITLITPVLALFAGQYLNNEVISTHVGWGAAVVIAGLASYQWGEKVFKSLVCCNKPQTADLRP